MKTERRRGPITRPSAGTSVGLMVASATITVLITRFYLFVTGYPQVGGEIFHIAHAVWGGLLLMIGLFIALAMANRWSALVGGLVGGIGAGCSLTRSASSSPRTTTTSSRWPPRSPTAC